MDYREVKQIINEAERPLYERDNMNRDMVVKFLIEDAKKEHFTEEYRDSITDANALGVLISKYFKWDGIQILDCLQEALQDANFHTINKEISSLRDREGV